jgi:hypothetical protein
MPKSTCLMLFVMTIGCGADPTARVRNESAAKLTDVRLSGRGFASSIAEIPPGEVRVVTIKPSGETGVAVSFLANGHRFSVPSQGYVEGSSSYDADIHVRPDFSVEVRTDLVAR